ncbi:MAG: hypothetical protein Q4P06_02300 [Actinomycetaceae bacterium]|nr:hypothetical protein [Actinomycetaceae bacterium]
MQRPSVLVISFSPIHRDARVLREISAIAKVADVTSIGYGQTPPEVVEHIEIPSSASSLPQTVSGVLKLGLRRWKAAELAAPATKVAIEKLRGRKFDLVVANDARALPCAFAVNGDAPVWADLHEYAPEERTHVKVWKLLVAPLMDHLCRQYLPRCAATTTVGEEIAKLYQANYQVKPRLLRNTASYQELQPTPVPDSGPIRLVHSGAAVYGRNLEATIEAVKQAGENYTLDLFLVKGNDGGKYYAQLQAATKDCPRIRLCDPVAPADLPKTLNQYDVGVFWIPPFNTNARLTLPNKIFDYIQARIGIAVGPTVEMQRLVTHYQMGTVSTDYEIDSIVECLRSITKEQVKEWKHHADRAAHEINFEVESRTIADIVTTLTSR